jgi:L-cystine uptake protein TcyP (sodium:dicarboxylate symporter family)
MAAQRFVAAHDGCNGKYGCGGQYPFTIAVLVTTIDIVARVRRRNFYLHTSLQF